MYGASTLPKLDFELESFAKIVAAAVIWVVIYSVLSARVLNKKDV